MFAIDTNLLVYAHNVDSEFHAKAWRFMEQVMNDRNAQGQLSVCIPAQVLMEFVHVITWNRLENPLSLEQAMQVVQDYLDAGVIILSQQNTQVQTFLELLSHTTSRKKIFDAALAATLKDNGITQLYTVNVKDFDEFHFLTAVNPLDLA